jgi:predicted ATPase/transcriptional regulator with XRE-family HTH domain
MPDAAGTVPDSFGARLRRLREDAGLSQEELAEQADLTRKAIGALERGERRRPYPATVRHLAEALGLSAEERATLLALVPSRGEMRAHSPVGPLAETTPPSGAASTVSAPILPTPLTPLIGRETDVAVVTGILHDGARLLTLTGPGGVGKSRLALQVATEAAPGFRDGVRLVLLAPLAIASLVLSTIAHALGVREAGGQPVTALLQSALQGRRLLLLLDNCEHVLEGVADLGTILEGCPQLVVLATSRIPLRLRGEQGYPVSPLALPTFERALTRDEALASPAVRLFVDRAQAASPGFELTVEDASAVAAICGRLDGLPLALELAAPRVKLQPPTALLARLHRALPLLTGGARDGPARQQTLQATLDWSYTLLSPAEQGLFVRLGVFAGSFDAATAAAVCGDDGQETEPIIMLEQLAALADQSLLDVLSGPEPRFRLLETVREYALLRLRERSEQRTIRERHARHFLALAEAALGPELLPTPAYLACLETERDNLRAAMEWAKEAREAELGLRLICAHREFWLIRGQCIEGQQRAEEALAIGGDVPTLLRSQALGVAGFMARVRGDLARAIVLQEQSLALARELSDPLQIADACQQLGVLAAFANDTQRARSRFEESLALTRAAGNIRGIAISTHLLAWFAWQQGQPEQAQAWWEESLALYRELGDRARMAWISSNLAEIAVGERELQRARDLLLEGLALGEEAGYAFISMYFLETLANVATLEGDPRSAAQFLAAAGGARAMSGVVREPAAQALLQRVEESGRAQIGDAAWDRAYEEGSALPFEEALGLARAYASEITDSAATRPSSR